MPLCVPLQDHPSQHLPARPEVQKVNNSFLLCRKQHGNESWFEQSHLLSLPVFHPGLCYFGPGFSLKRPSLLWALQGLWALRPRPLCSPVPASASFAPGVTLAPPGGTPGARCAVYPRGHEGRAGMPRPLSPSAPRAPALPPVEGDLRRGMGRARRTHTPVATLEINSHICAADGPRPLFQAAACK